MALRLLLLPVVAVACVMMGVVSGAQLQAQEAPGQKWALLIGVDDYAEITDLRFAGNDQRAFAHSLIAAGFPTDQVFLLEDKAKDKKYLPFRENIERQLELMLKLVERQDLLIVGFSGHGVHLDGKSYLCPSEARLNAPNETMIPLDSIYERLANCPAALKLLFVDACRDDPRPAGQRNIATPRSGAEFATSLERPPAGLLLMTSCAPGQVSMEDDAMQHGVFMNFILEGLRGKAANQEGSITLASLYDYSSLATKKYVARKWNGYQSPMLKGQIDGPFELSRVDREPIENSIGMKLVPIPAGEFLMGSPADEQQRTAEVEQQHLVRITKPFYMSAHEVTLGQYLKFYHDAGYHVSAESDGKGGTGYVDGVLQQRSDMRPWNWGYRDETRQHPVVNVTWNDCDAFCRWLSQKEGKKYRIPTEAEWEYACRAGTTTRYNSGDSFDGLMRVANVEGTDDGYERTAPVGRFPPNAFGLYDMHGNAWEWVNDWFSLDYYTMSAVKDPQGPDTGTYYLVRGGGWNGLPKGCRSASRCPVDADYRHPDTGFRVIREK